MRVLVLHNEDQGLQHGQPHDALAARGVLQAAAAVETACRANGWEAVRMPAPPEPHAFLRTVGEARAHVVFNLVEGLGGDSRLEAAAAWLLELAGIPYTGSAPLALALALEKPLVKDLLHGRGVPVPGGAVLERGDEPLHGLRWPCIVKPAHEDASHGISSASVVETDMAARARARWVRERYAQAALVEEFVAGREFNVSLLGEGGEAQVLPLAEIDFEQFPAGRPRLVTYEAKWVPESPEYRGTESIPARPLAPDIETALVSRAAAAYRALGLRDYGRVDLRLDAQAGALVLEVNPNPDLSPDAGLARAARRADIPYEALVGGIVRAALERGHGASEPGRG